MLEKAVIERLLITNGVDPNGPDEEIKSVLFSAKWHEDDIETALLVLRENTETHQKRVDSLHKVFRTDDKLSPETISALLGIDVDIPVERDSRRAKKSSASAKEMMNITFISLTLSVIFALTAMWYLKMGPFYIGL